MNSQDADVLETLIDENRTLARQNRELVELMWTQAKLAAERESRIKELERLAYE